MALDNHQPEQPSPARGVSTAAPTLPPDPAPAPVSLPAAPNGFIPARWNQPWLFGLALFVATVLFYLPALPGTFVWDDWNWTTKIVHLLRDFSGLVIMWIKPDALQQYHPLTGTSFWLDYHLWGFWTPPYHLENVLLHATAALLFWRLLRRLEVPGAWLASAIFALHPVMVESAGWITERKNVLSMVFFLGSLFAYGRFVNFWKSAEGEPSAAPGESNLRRRAFLLAWFLFLGALLAKATTITLPAVLLVLGWWKRGRLRWREDVLPTVPFFSLAIGLGLVTVWVERYHLGAKGPEWAHSFAERCLLAGRAPWHYAAKLLWPANLCFVYPRWHLDASSFGQWLYPLGLLALLFGLWLLRGQLGRGPAAAAFYFTGTLFPVLGFVNVYFMRYSFVCDHWCYLSSLGLIALGAALATRAAERFGGPEILQGFAAVALLLLGVLTWREGRMFRDVETLYRTTIARNPQCAMAYNNLGLLLLEQHRLDEAQAQFQHALAVQPNHASAQNNLAMVLLQKGQVAEAKAGFRQALSFDPNYASAEYNLGLIAAQEGQLEEAKAHFLRTIAIDPGHGGAENNLGMVFLQQGRLPDAKVHLQRALQIAPRFPEALLNYANVLLGLGELREGMAQLEKVLQLQPNHPYALSGLAAIMSSCPDAALRNGPRAVAYAEQADRVSKSSLPWVRVTLAQAYAEAGRFPEAISVAQQMLQWATSQHENAMADLLRKQLALYQAHTPYRQPAAGKRAN